MSATMHQLQGVCNSPRCSLKAYSISIKDNLNRCWMSAGFRVHRDEFMSKQGLIFSSELVSRRNRKPVVSAMEFSPMPKDFEVSSLSANGSLPYVSEAEKITGFPRESEQLESSESRGSIVVVQRKWDRVWEVVSHYFVTLDATVKITMLIFIPCCVAIGVIYGVEVLKELTPLWIVGPLIVAIDIRMFQSILQLYVFSFKHAEKVIRSIPSPKKLIEATYTYFSQKLAEMKSVDCSKEAKMKLLEIMRWQHNISMAVFDLSWPLYWRVVRFLTRSNLIAPKF